MHARCQQYVASTGVLNNQFSPRVCTFAMFRVVVVVVVVVVVFVLSLSVGSSRW